jgi:ABC-type multidrug transport system fused ATPase/permease subunit
MNAWWTPSNRQLIRRYLRTFRPYGPRNRGLVAGASLLLLILTVVTLPLPWLTMKGIDVMVQSHRPSMVWMILGVWGAALLLKMGLGFYQGYCTDRFKHRVSVAGKLKLFRHIQTLPVAFFRERQTGYLVCRVRDDIDNLGPLWAESVLQVAKSLIFLMVALVLVFVISWKLALLSLLTVPLYLINYLIFGDRVRVLTRESRECYSVMEGKMHDAILTAPTVKMFSREVYEARELAHLMVASVRKAFRLEMFTRLSGNLGSFTQALAPLFVLAYAGAAIVQGRMTVGELVAFITYIGFLFEPVTLLVRKNLDMQRAMASLERIFEILDVPAEHNRRPRCIAPPKRVRGRIEFENVSYSYDGEKDALQGIDLVIPARATIGLAGPSGAGKSTFINLIPRILEPTRGRILLDGTDLRDIPLSVLRGQIGIVAQDTFLFSKSICENIRYGRLDATDEEVELAARRAYAHDFVSRLPHGYDTQVGNQGMKLSGGERARIAIARALLRDPAILILDEATAFLDSRSETYLQEAIEELLHDRTALVIAHRLSTIELTDRILVLDAGAIEEAGSHDELLARGGLYRRLYDEQFLKSSPHGSRGGNGNGNGARPRLVLPPVAGRVTTPPVTTAETATAE